MKCYSTHGCEDVYKDAFNKSLRRGRMKIENAFAHLKNRWRILKFLNVTILYGLQVILACVALHNFYRENHDNFDGLSTTKFHNFSNMNDLNVPLRLPKFEREPTRRAAIIRNTLFQYWKHRIVEK